MICLSTSTSQIVYTEGPLKKKFPIHYGQMVLQNSRKNHLLEK